MAPVAPLAWLQLSVLVQLWNPIVRERQMTSFDKFVPGHQSKSDCERQASDYADCTK